MCEEHFLSVPPLPLKPSHTRKSPLRPRPAQRGPSLTLLPGPGEPACLPWVAQPCGGISLRRAEAPPSHLDPRAQLSWLRLPRVSVKLTNILLILNNHVGLAGLPPPDRWRTHASGSPALHINLSLLAFSTSFRPRPLSSFSS